MVILYNVFQVSFGCLLLIILMVAMYWVMMSLLEQNTKAGKNRLISTKLLATCQITKVNNNN